MTSVRQLQVLWKALGPNVYVCARVCACARLYIDPYIVSVCVHVHAYEITYIYSIYVCACVYIHTCVHVHTTIYSNYACVRTHIYMCIHIHTLYMILVIYKYNLFVKQKTLDMVINTVTTTLICLLLGL